MTLVSVGINLVEIGVLLVLSLGIAHLLKKFDIPTVLGLILGGLVINIILVFLSYPLENFFTDLRGLKSVITELALAWIGYEIGSHIDLSFIQHNTKKFSLILVSEAIGAFIIVIIGFFIFLPGHSLGLALLMGSIAMATAPAATSQVLKEYGAEGELTQIILFIVAFDDILSILFANVSFGVIDLTYGSASIDFFNLLIRVFFDLIIDLLSSIVMALIGAIFILFLLRLKVITEKTLLEWLLGVSFILVAIALLFNFSVIISMFVWGLLLKLFEDRKPYQALKQHIQKLDVITVPIVLLFFILIGLSMEIKALLTVSTLAFAILYFLLRGLGKASGTFTACSLFKTSNEVKYNLPISLLTQAGIAIGLAGLAFQRLTALGASNDALFVLNIVGVSVILSEIFGPFLLKQGLIRSGEGKLQIQNIKDITIE